MTDDTRRVPADAAVVSYCQLEMVRLIAEGADHAAASAAGWALFGRLVQAATGMTLAEPGSKVSVPTSCLADSAGAIRDAFTMPYEQFRELHPQVRASVVLPQDTVDRLAWLADGTGRLANGVPLGDAMRQASDAWLGKPRQKRRPVTSRWLIERITETESAVWSALAAQQPYRRPVITGLPAGRLPSDPPAATLAAAEDRG